METRNRLVNQETKENYSSQDSAGIWEYYIEEGVLKSSVIGGISGDDLEPSENCDSLEDFEAEISEQFTDPREDEVELAFSGLTEEERKEQDNWIKLRNLINNGYIVHDPQTGEEWLTNMDDLYIMTYTNGDTSEWNTEEAKESGVEYDAEGYVPSEVQAGYVKKEIYYQKNQEVNNPCALYEFEVTDEMIRCNNVN
ncbi:hypothetical protein [Mesonia aestuariivivens]|uniref:Uncharacterized protein n=1 Tax=Mesonia aestuariivivens TaxID=2796128 RepID=A0ABS6W390_9FLAO|nr:hypothetical protein [Mesonia aestuariivivens]MBW2962322.1 hypothetical protein [Mesonia aestuariivivens]